MLGRLFTLGVKPGDRFAMEITPWGATHCNTVLEVRDGWVRYRDDGGWTSEKGGLEFRVCYRRIPTEHPLTSVVPLPEGEQ